MLISNLKRPNFSLEFQIAGVGRLGQIDGAILKRTQNILSTIGVNLKLKNLILIIQVIIFLDREKL